ncbi:MAG: MgtC/SapB family protein [Gemmatimonadaceae bacterium]
MNELREFIEILRLDLGAKLFIAILVGGGIGLERELRRKPAGLRTNILICVGSALLMDLSMALAFAHGGDPGRIAAQVVTGIGFLGAGTILHTRGTITGLTSAATIWVVAAIGLTVGAGFHFEALAATMTVMVVLRGLGWLEGRFLTAESDSREGLPADEWQRRGEGRRSSDRGDESSSRAPRPGTPPPDRD